MLKCYLCNRPIASVPPSDPTLSRRRSDPDPDLYLLRCQNRLLLLLLRLLDTIMPAFRGHDSARKFHCDVPGCSASFVKRAHLRRHEMTHTQRRDFSCPGCNRAFSRNDSMARHLRRKHPHLYRSQENAPSATTGVERLYTGSVVSVSGSSTSMGNPAPASGYSLLSLRSPFDNGIGSPVQRRSDDFRSLPDPLGRTSTSSDYYAREAVLHSPKGASSTQWRAAGPSRIPDPSYAAPGLPQVSRSMALYSPAPESH